MTIPINVLLRSRHEIVAMAVDGVPGEALPVDAYLSEQHRVRNRISQYPLESGANLVDHVVRDPIKLKLRGAVSSTPLSDLSAEEYASRQRDAAVGAAGGIGFDITSVDIEQAPNDHLPAKGWETILRFADEATLLSVTTMLGTYENFVIEEAKTSLDAFTGRNAIYEIDLLEIRTTGQIVGLDLLNIDERPPVVETSGPAVGRETEQRRGHVNTAQVALPQADLDFLVMLNG